MMRVPLLALSALMVAGAAHASFDVALLPSTNGRMFRYDPVNNVNLGSFNVGLGVRATALAPNGAQEIVLVRESQASRFNFATGERLGQTYVFAEVDDLQWNPARNSFDLHFLRTTGNSFIDSLAFPNLSQTLGPLFTSAPVDSVLRLGSGRYLGLHSGAGTVNVLSAPSYGVQATSNTQTWGTGIRVSNMIEVANGVAWFATIDGTNSITLRVINAFGVNQVVLNDSLLQGSLTGFANAGGLFLNSSHQGVYVYGQDASSSNWRVAELSQLNSFTWSVESNVVTSIPFTPAKPSTFLAPEPGSMAALGLGVVAMLKRRKKARK